MTMLMMVWEDKKKCGIPVGEFESSEESNRDELPIELTLTHSLMKDLRWEFFDFLSFSIHFLLLPKK